MAAVNRPRLRPQFTSEHLRVQARAALAVTEHLSPLESRGIEIWASDPILILSSTYRIDSIGHILTPHFSTQHLPSRLTSKQAPSHASSDCPRRLHRHHCPCSPKIYQRHLKFHSRRCEPQLGDSWVLPVLCLLPQVPPGKWHPSSTIIIPILIDFLDTS